jgi:hypothetical protein
MGERDESSQWTTHARLNQACNHLQMCTDTDDWGFEALLAFALEPWVWLEPATYLGSAHFPDGLTAHWARVAFPTARVLEMDEHGFALVHHVWIADKCVPLGLSPVRIPLSHIGFHWAQLEDPWDACGEPIRVVPRSKRRSFDDAAEDSRLSQRRQRILEIIKSLGFEPRNLPARAPGMPGVKARVRSVCRGEPALFTLKTFKKAWQDLRDGGDIVGAD